MKLLYDLPDKEKKVISPILGEEKILYCVPYDLDTRSQFTDGWTVVTTTRVIFLMNGEVENVINIDSAKDFKSIGLVGCGMLEATVNGTEKILVRYSIPHIPRYSYIAKALEQLGKGETPQIRSIDEEDRCPRCGRVYTPGTKVCYHCSSKLSILKRLALLIKPYWYLMALAIGVFWFITGLRLLIPYVYRVFIDSYLSVRKKDLGAIIAIVLIIAGCNLLSTLFTIIRGRVMVKIGSFLSKDLKAMVYTKLQLLSINYLSARKTGELMNRVTGDTETMQNFIHNQLGMGFNEILVLIGVGILLFASNWKMALLVIVPAPLVMFISWKIRTRIGYMYRNQWRVWDKANSLLQDILSGIRVVKSFGREPYEVEHFRDASRKLADVTARNEKAWNTLFPALGYIMGMGNYFVMLYGGSLVLGVHMKVGELIQFLQYAGMFYGPLNWMCFFPRWFTEAMTATERIFEIIDEDPDVKDLDNARPHSIIGNVSFRNVTFGYKSHEPVLEEINLDVKKGEMIGLVGHSGAGKSTLINLLMRFYDVDEGEISIDGVNIKEIRQQDLRSQIGVVLQETFLFSGTILDNIKYSKPDATLEDVIRAAKIANAHDFIIRFPDGYNTKVGERGQLLSGGERQRIAIARAILHDPKILILDEATASVDTETEQQIQEALSRLIQNRTTFAIAHRLSTLRNANRLLVLDKGKCAELGTHDELLKAKGTYYRLVMAQRQMSKVQETQAAVNS